jgi:5-methylcytosine-specific restriction endonuclease McrA
VERIAPRSFLRALIHDAEGRPINASGRQRHPTARQKRVVRERDRACVDCGSTEFLEYDHDPPYEVTKHTVVAELKPLCWNCHHRRHRAQQGAA